MLTWLKKSADVRMSRHITAVTTRPEIVPKRIRRGCLYFSVRTKTTIPSTKPASVRMALNHT
ncbi:hypothetical protein D3C85_1823870 [compost metagenome]